MGRAWVQSYRAWIILLVGQPRLTLLKSKLQTKLDKSNYPYVDIHILYIYVNMYEEKDCKNSYKI